MCLDCERHTSAIGDGPDGVWDAELDDEDDEMNADQDPEADMGEEEWVTIWDEADDSGGDEDEDEDDDEDIELSEIDRFWIWAYGQREGAVRDAALGTVAAVAAAVDAGDGGDGGGGEGEQAEGEQAEAEADRLAERECPWCGADMANGMDHFAWCQKV